MAMSRNLTSINESSKIQAIMMPEGKSEEKISACSLSIVTGNHEAMKPEGKCLCRKCNLAK